MLQYLDRSVSLILVARLFSANAMRPVEIDPVLSVLCPHQGSSILADADVAPSPSRRVMSVASKFASTISVLRVKMPVQ